MRFYVVRIEYVRSAKAENRQLYAYDSADEAVAQFHTILGQDMKNENLDWALVTVLNSAGGVHRSEKWINPVPEVIPEPEPIPEDEPVEETPESDEEELTDPVE